MGYVFIGIVNPALLIKLMSTHLVWHDWSILCLHTPVEPIFGTGIIMIKIVQNMQKKFSQIPGVTGDW